MARLSIVTREGLRVSIRASLVIRHTFIHESYDFRTPSFSDIGSPTFGLLDTAKSLVQKSKAPLLRATHSMKGSWPYYCPFNLVPGHHGKQGSFHSTTGFFLLFLH